MALIQPPQDFLERLRARPVVVIAGAGVTAATVNTPIASWTGLLKQFIDTHTAAEEQEFAFGKVELTLRTRPTAERLISAAAELRDAWGEDTFYTWIGEQFRRLNDAERTPGVIQAIGAFDCPILTTNFDTLIEATLSKQWQVLEETEQGIGIINNEYPDVLHIHGCHMKSSGLVIDKVGYDRVLAHENAQALLTNLASKTLLFVGCGSTVDDPNIGTLYRLLTQLSGFDSSVHHYRLVREREGRTAGRVVTNITYGDDFADLEPFLQTIRQAVWRPRPSGGGAPAAATAPVVTTPAPADLRVRIDGTTVVLECSTTNLEATFTSRPDWARATTIRRLEAMLYVPASADTGAEQLVDTAQLLGNHLLMSHGTALAGALRALPSDQPARLVLDIQDEDSRRRPWECLYSRNQLQEEPKAGFVARSLDCSIVRAGAAGRQWTFAPREHKPLNVLLAIADPHDSLKAGDLHGALEALGTGIVSVQPPDREHGKVTIKTISDALETWSASDQRPVDILHIVAQVRSGDSGATIELDDEETLRLDQVGPLSEAHPPRLVVLQLQPADGAGASVVLDAAYAASTGGVPNLVAVHHNVGHASTSDHLKAMFVALHSGERLDRALQLARAKYLEAHQLRESVCFPALFVELGTEAALFRIERERDPLDASQKQDVGGPGRPMPPNDSRSGGRKVGNVAAKAPPPVNVVVDEDAPRTARPETSKAPIGNAGLYTGAPDVAPPQGGDVAGGDQ